MVEASNTKSKLKEGREMPVATLNARYLSALDSIVGGQERLAQQLKQEDEYQCLVANLVRQHGGSDEVLESYALPPAFSGGGRACLELLAHVSEDLAAAARRASVQLPPFLAAWWPERSPAAESALGDGGSLIRVNVGLLVQLRMFMHLVCGLLATITGNAKQWGEDRLTVEGARTEFLDMLDEYVGGQEVPLGKTVRVHWGQRDYFRRLASLAGLGYVVAHELGHLETKNQEYLQSALTRKGDPLPGRQLTEVQAVASFNMEAHADFVAVRILNEWNPVEGELWKFARVVGAASVMAIQSAKFWIEAAATDKQLDWMHPHPDLRIAGLCLGLANPEELARLELDNPAAMKPIETESSARALQFKSWLERVTGVEQFREAALKKGLKDRGLTAMQLAAIYLAYGTPKEDV